MCLTCCHLCYQKVAAWIYIHISLNMHFSIIAKTYKKLTPFLSFGGWRWEWEVVEGRCGGIPHCLPFYNLIFEPH